MKKLLVTCAITLLLCGGCSSIYKASIAVTEVRDSIMTELGVHYRAGLISPETDAKIAQADAAYRIAAQSAAESLKLYKATGEGDPAQILLGVKNQVSVLIGLLSAYQNVTHLESNLGNATKL